MLEFIFNYFRLLFDPVGFPARWYCGTWSEALGWIHIISDSVTALSYFAIPTVIILYVQKKKNIQFHYLFWFFAAFIFFCGLEHLIEASIFWHPWYRLAGLAKMITAMISVATVIMLIKILPQAIAIPERLQSYQRLFAISQSLPISFFLVNHTGKVIHANDKALSIFGKSILKQTQSQNVLLLFEEEIRLKVQSINGIRNFVGQTPPTIFISN